MVKGSLYFEHSRLAMMFVRFSMAIWRGTEVDVSDTCLKDAPLPSTFRDESSVGPASSL